MKSLCLVTIILAMLSLVLAACGAGTPQPTATPAPTATPSLGRIEGVISQQTTAAKMGGTVKLMLEKYLKATPEATVTLQPSEFIEAKVGEDGKFVIDGIQPGRYYVEASVTLTPCFLGAPGQVFNGMMVSFMENWSPVGLSFKDGSSLINGKTQVLDVVAGEALKVTLGTPRCY